MFYNEPETTDVFQFIEDHLREHPVGWKKCKECGKWFEKLTVDGICDTCRDKRFEWRKNAIIIAIPICAVYLVIAFNMYPSSNFINLVGIIIFLSISFLATCIIYIMLSKYVSQYLAKKLSRFDAVGIFTLFTSLIAICMILRFFIRH